MIIMRDNDRYRLPGDDKAFDFVGAVAATVAVFLGGLIVALGLLAAVGG